MLIAANVPLRNDCEWCGKQLNTQRFAVQNIYCSTYCANRGDVRHAQRLEQAARMCTACTWNAE